MVVNLIGQRSRDVIGRLSLRQLRKANYQFQLV